jgi:hypothetical protein
VLPEHLVRDGFRTDRRRTGLPFGRSLSELPRMRRNRAAQCVLMFYDAAWLSQRTDAQEERLHRWLGSVSRLVTVELGAGTTLPTIRRFSERHGPRVIRINVREPQIDPAKGIGIQGGALETLVALDHALTQATGT